MPRFSPRLAIALLLLVPLILLGPGLLPGMVIADHGTEEILPMGDPTVPSGLPQANADTVRENLVYRKLLAESLGRGEMPWWEPTMYGGGPFVAMSHTQALYPLTWLTLPLSPTAAHSWLLWLHVSLAGLGAFAWLRAAGRSDEASTLGAVAFMLNGMFATRHGHPQYVAVGAWLPWMLFGVEHLFSQGHRRWLAAVGIAGCSAMMVLAGHPSIYVFGSYFVGLYLLWRAWGTDRALAVQGIGLFAAGYAAGVALASTQLLAVLELADFSARSQRTLSGLTRRLHHWIHLLRLLFPDLTGSPVHGDYWSPRFTHYWAGTLYTGVAPLFLALLAPVFAWKRARWVFGVTAAVVAVLFVPVAFQLVYPLPGFDFGRVDRLAIAFFLGMAWLTALGFDAIEGDRERQRPLIALGVVVIGAAAIAVPAASSATSLIARMPATWSTAVAGRAVALGLGLCVAALGLLAQRARFSRTLLAWALLALMLVDLGPWWRAWAPARDAAGLFPPTETTDFLTADAPPHRIAKYIPEEVRGTAIWPMFPSNTPAAYGIEEIHGFGPLHMHGLDLLLGAAERERSLNPWHVAPFMDAAALDSPILDLLNVRYIVAAEPVGDLPIAARAELVVHENLDTLPRAWFVGGWERFGSPSAAAAALADGSLDPRTSASLLDGEPVSPSKPSAVGEVALVARSRNRITVEKRGADAGLVVLSETWYPGWTATVDGEPARVFRANVMQRAVPVGPGTHTVELAYAPTFAGRARLLTLLGGLAILGLLIGAWRARDQ
ncbi:MAG: hypothetical protein EP330_10190 [Deltaproteobacteria bacterium]|nr:MAG: hypothetical protein EP330_10190 [Deltaproteobacteria bacterium]